MAIIDAYIPMDRRHALARGEDLPDRSHGSVLFADISGFTGFNYALYQELGPQLSAEELTHHLNSVYGGLIGEVHRYGGSVISFGGDAITCWFDQDRGRRGTACALDIQKVMAQMGTLSTPIGKQFQLGIKVAVTSGNARRFLVGQERIQRIEVLAGEILDRMAGAEKQLNSGEVVVGSEVMGRLGNQASVEEWRRDDNEEYFAVISGLNEPVPDQPWSLPPDLETDLALQWLLPPVYLRLLRGEGEYIAELRSAVATFIKFHGIDYDRDDEAGDKLDAYVRWVQRVLEQYEGSLLQLNIGDKGSYMFAAFGAHVTHEDDVDRALAASSKLIVPPDELNFIQDVSIGITQGQVRAGAYGAPIRRTYGIQGNEVNLAAKLMDHAAPGQVLTSPRIVKEASRRYDFRKLEPLQIKDFEQPLPVYVFGSQLIDKETDILGRSIYPIVGREAEKRVIMEGIRALSEGHSRVVLITGDAGIGKTRLVEYALRQARRSGVYVLIGAGDEIRRNSPYFAWRSIFSQLFSLDQVGGEIESSSREERRARILDRLGELPSQFADLAPLLNAVLPLDIPENELTRQMTGEVRADNTRKLLVGLLSQVAKTIPLHLILEDAHWLDSASWKVVQAVSREVKPLLFIIAHRPLSDPKPTEYDDLLAEAHVRNISLSLFSPDEVRDLICQILEAQKLPGVVLDFVYEKAEGNPFFSEELVYALRDAELIRVVDGECQITTSPGELLGLDFPDTSQAVIRSRIDRLNPQEKLALKVASVIGRNFSYRVLHDIHPVETDKPNLRDYLDTLERLTHTRQISPEPDLTYMFKHIITQEVAYNMMLFTQRRELHRATAEWYERNYAEELDQVYPLLAHHWNQTQDVHKAVEFLEKAGEQAMRNFANQEAIGFIKDALVRVDEVGLEMEPLRRAQWELLIGEAYVNLADYTQGREHIEAGLTLLGQPVPSGTLAQYGGVLGQVLSQGLHRLLPPLMIGRRADEQEVLLAASRACERLVEVYYVANETALSLYTAFHTLNLAESAGPSPELARGYATVGALIGFIPLHSAATSYLRRALETVKEIDDLNAHAWVATVVAFYYAGVGNWEEAIRLGKQVVEISERLGDQRRREDAMGILFALEYFQGDFESSAQIAEKLIRVSRRRNAEHSLAFGLQGGAYTSLHQGRYEIAMDYLAELKTLMLDDSKITDEALMIEMCGLLCLTHLRRSEFQAALETAEKAYQMGDKTMPSNFSSFSGFAGPACVYLSLWEAGHAFPNPEGLAKKALNNLRKFARVFPIGKPRLRLYEGWRNWLAGRRSRAHQDWENSLERALELGMRYDQGLAHLEIGRHFPAGSLGRKEHLEKAADLFTQLGAGHDLERAQSALEAG